MTLFDKVLVANRGEIAVRVIRTCRRLGIRTVAVYSKADELSLPVRLADEAVCVGPASARESYLHIPNIIGAALRTGADAIHPGYGFLSEDPYFAEICADHGITFIGPSAGVMDVLGDKSSARRVMRENGLPLLPGTVEPLGSYEEARRIADDIGYPVILKAAAGGGGRGITVVRDPADLFDAFHTTRASARTLFKDPSLYLEKYLESARHIEVQVLCDSHGRGVHLGERDCSVQRRNQKLLEEAPSPAVDESLRREIGEAALRGALEAGYQGVGTMEFLLDEQNRFWFMEVNTRIQVEHPVTEAVTGIDLVAEQLHSAAGEPLALRQSDIEPVGHAVECRINAEDPARGFVPTPGTLHNYRAPGGPWVRVDTHCHTGAVVTPHYDSLVAKLVCWGPDRESALDRTSQALREFELEGNGVSSTIGLQRTLVEDAVLRDGGATTGFLRARMPEFAG
ncbi:acetyl-CoA carboxylase biotin carboxylase subunit [Actinopolyspora sp. H202]|uniref:acetyl-CoA carboxylase biotin carboxylase subunit n=1 Tax=Actinopolyspora sp. H202 TaxID=1500456 RepID=UPI003EE4BC1F